MINIDLQNHCSEQDLPSLSQLQRWLVVACDQLPTHIDNHRQHITICLVDEQESSELNQQYRHKSGPTNVLSFPDDPIPGFSSDTLGEIIICVTLVKQEAQQQNKILHAHWAHLLIHGFLHLLGYDHIEEQDANIMENLEITILQKLGFDNPYSGDPSRCSE